MPVILCGLFNQTAIGYTIALGALCVSIADAPGPVEHKRNGMLFSIVFITLMALLTGFATRNIFILGILIALSSFFFSMFTIYGARATAVGTAALLLMILRLSTILPPLEVLKESLFIMCGGFWYMLIALIFFRLTPYRPGQRALGECIHEMSKYLNIKAEFYRSKTAYDDDYHRLVAQQIVVNEKQDALRELLYKNRQLISESTLQGKLLILTFADVMELYEQMTATWYDYESLQTKFGSSGVMEDISSAIRKLAAELDYIGLAIQSNIATGKHYLSQDELVKIKAKIDAFNDADPGNLVLKKILVNMLNINKRVNGLYNYFRARRTLKQDLQPENYYAKFVSHQPIDLKLFRNNLHLESSVFRHSLRTMITCVAGFTIAKFISYGHHSYWILLTIIIILKPGFGLTQERNLQRITGTIAGGLLGIGILAFVKDRDVLSGLIIFFMIGTYTYQRVNYIVTVIFTTPYILILFNLLGLPFWDIARERLLDTGIGCVLALMASYLLFPHWESGQLQTYMQQVLKANIDYLYKLKDMMCGRQIPQLDYKLVRKELYVSIANLSAAFHRMLNDPKSKQQNRRQADQFVVLNHILSSNVASLASEIKDGGEKNYPKDILQKTTRAIRTMEETLQTLDTDYEPENNSTEPVKQPSTNVSTNLQLHNHLDFINKIAGDINKTTKTFAA